MTANKAYRRPAPHLPTEIIEKILSNIPTPPYNCTFCYLADLRNFSLVSRSWNRTAFPALYFELQLCFVECRSHGRPRHDFEQSQGRNMAISEPESTAPKNVEGGKLRRKLRPKTGLKLPLGKPILASRQTDSSSAVPTQPILMLEQRIYITLNLLLRTLKEAPDTIAKMVRRIVASESVHSLKSLSSGSLWVAIIFHCPEVENIQGIRLVQSVIAEKFQGADWIEETTANTPPMRLRYRSEVEKALTECRELRGLRITLDASHETLQPRYLPLSEILPLAMWFNNLNYLSLFFSGYRVDVKETVIKFLESTLTSCAGLEKLKTKALPVTWVMEALGSPGCSVHSGLKHLIMQESMMGPNTIVEMGIVLSRVLNLKSLFLQSFFGFPIADLEKFLDIISRKSRIEELHLETHLMRDGRPTAVTMNDDDDDEDLQETASSQIYSNRLRALHWDVVLNTDLKLLKKWVGHRRAFPLLQRVVLPKGREDSEKEMKEMVDKLKRDLTLR